MAEVIKKCIDCKRAFTSTHPKQVRCLACQEIRNKELREQYRQQQKHKAKQPTDPDPNECKRKKSCKYGGNMGGVKICDYYTITGERRGCPVQGCTKYKRKPRNKKQEVDNEHVLDKQ